MKPETGMILDIHRSALHDGPGIRTTVFLKGCPLPCQWCHNPESVSSNREIAFFRDKCTLCGACVEACPEHAHRIENDQHIFDRSLGRLHGTCVEACLYGALSMTGKVMKDVEVIELVLRDKAYYDESGGGLTLSGGEPMYQFVFTLSVMKMAKAAGIHT